MTVQTALAIALVVGLGTTQYALMVQALRDLARRPRVRGGNKVAWGLLILCVPLVGALIYSWMGPTSLVRRAQAPVEQPITRRPMHDVNRAFTRQNITPISEARRRRSQQRPRPQSDKSSPRRFTRTGS